MPASTNSNSRLTLSAIDFFLLYTSEHINNIKSYINGAKQKVVKIAITVKLDAASAYKIACT